MVNAKGTVMGKIIRPSGMKYTTHNDQPKPQTIEEKIDLILRWSIDNPDFNTLFIEDLKEKYDEYGDLTEFQENAIDNIIIKWRIF